MNFQGLGKVETAKVYLDTAFTRGRKRADEMREISKGTRMQKSKSIEAERIKSINRSLSKIFMRILEAFPKYSQLPPFYQELIKNNIGVAEFKRSLGGVNWVLKKVQAFSDQYLIKVRKCMDLQKINSYRREYIGRISSLVKQINDELKFLDNARKEMLEFPAIKTSLKTICLCGFPNVGKSTLLSKLTTSKPEIKNYAFTTKRLNTGYLEDHGNKIQLIDTPGTLNRFEKMNPIEKMAYLAVKHCADLIVYIFDLTETYPLKEQEKLYQQLKKFDKPMIVYLSKTDILDAETVISFKKHDKITDIEELKKHLFSKLA